MYVMLFPQSSFGSNTFLVGGLEFWDRKGNLEAGLGSTGLYTKLLRSSNIEDEIIKTFLVYRVSLRLAWET